MIYGMGTDIVDLTRIDALWQRRGEVVAKRFLAPSEHKDFACVADKPRFLAKRFAAKEAFAKALGTGLRGSVCLGNIAIAHDAMGKPFFHYLPILEAWLESLGIGAVHLSLADEKKTIIAFVIAEKK